MEPGIYKSFNGFKGHVQPLYAAEDHAAQGQGQDQAQQALRATPTATATSSQDFSAKDWTVYGPDVSRGNFNGLQDMRDPRSMVGWSATPKATVDTATSFVDGAGYMGKDDEATSRANNPQTSGASYPHPDLALPHPTLSLDFRMSVTLNPRVSLGKVPFGHRNWISFTGGTWSGSWGSGIVLPGGQDSQLIIPTGSTYLETNYLLQTHDSPPAHIVIKTHGWRTGSPEVLAKLNDPKTADTVDPRDYRFRIFIQMETGDERYCDKVNCGMWVGSGMRMGAEVVYDAYRVS